MDKFLRALHLPPAGRPRWIASEPQSPLLYLSWGARRYDRKPIPVSRHGGWVYFCLLQGSATLRLAATRKTLTAGDCAVIHPDCPNGWEGTAACRVLTWVWRSAPGELQEKIRGYRHFHLTPEQRKHLAWLHDRCRAFVQEPRELSDHALNALRVLMDFTLAQSRRRPETPADKQMAKAIEWIEHHLDAAEPVSELCNLLKVSAPTLFRLFKKNLREGPRAHFHHRRMQRAGELIRAGSQVKEAAHLLGYAYANDLSRALRNWKSRTSHHQNRFPVAPSTSL